MDLAIGIAAALLTIAILRPMAAARQRYLAGIFLAVAALIYLVLALWGGREWLGLELVGLASYSFLAVLGVRFSPWFLAAGWALHGPWDLFIHGGAPAHFVPDWYPRACLAYDLVLAGWVAWCVGRGRWPNNRRADTRLRSPVKAQHVR